MTMRTKLYLFYITFFAILAIFPIIDFTKFGLLHLDTSLLTPRPTETFKIALVLGCSSILAYFIMLIFIRKNMTDKLEYITISMFRFTLALAMMSAYGISKIAFKQFELNYSAMDTLLRDVSDPDLVWYFYGRSNVQTFLLGLAEVIPCILLLFRRTTFLGAVLLLPVLLGVVLVNTFNVIGTLDLVFAVMFTFFDIGILLFYRKEIATLFISAKNKLQFPFLGRKTRLLFSIAKIIFIGTFVIFFYDLLNYAIRVSSGKMYTSSKCLGAYQLQDITYNDKKHDLDSLPNYWNKLYFEKYARINILRDKWDNKVNMYYIFFHNKDSIQIVTYKKFDGDKNPLDTTSVFKGTYILSSNDSILTLKGIKNDTIIKAIYKKLPIDGHDWWW
jgi:hypothetical protein